MSEHETSARILFQLGQVVATPGAIEALDQTAVDGWALLHRHQTGDWGDVPNEDAEENMRSVNRGWRILSSYPLNDELRLWIITEADRSSTTMLLPEEY